MKSPIATALLLAIVTMVSCAPLTPEQQSVVATVRSITKYPVKRAELLDKLQLAGRPTRSMEETSKAGYSYTETWEDASGLIVRAHQWEPLRPGERLGGPYEPLLKFPARQGEAPEPSRRLVRMSFKQLMVMNARGKVLFDSNAPEEVARRGVGR